VFGGTQRSNSELLISELQNSYEAGHSVQTFEPAVYFYHVHHVIVVCCMS